MLKKHNDLCSTCEYALSCSFHSNPATSVFFCEEFEVGKPSLEKTGKKNPIVHNSTNKKKEKESASFFGLCINCENRGICVNSRKEGGVWYCEQYQ
jgi:hypothetical protein